MLQYSNALQQGNKLPSRQLLGLSIGCLDKSFDTLLGLSSNIEQQSSGALNRVLSEPCHGKCDQQKDRLASAQVVICATPVVGLPVVGFTADCVQNAAQ